MIKMVCTKLSILIEKEPKFMIFLLKKKLLIYIELAGGKARPVTEFKELVPNMTFKEFNLYINSLDSKI